jgi:lipoyl(octanoyl) transferase
VIAPTWQLWVDLTGRPGWQNMAVDQALLDRAQRGERWLRLYRWSPHCLSFGRHEPALQRYDRTRIRDLGLDVVRRPTGGRAVWHAEELTYALAVPSAVLGGLRQAYEEIHRMLVAALGLLGIHAQLAGARRASGIDAGACFSSPAGGEIMVGGRKAVGSAQLREGGALLQHGSILLAGRQALVHELTVGRAAPDLAGPIQGPNGDSADPARVADAVATAASEHWGGQWSRTPMSEALVGEAVRHEVRFRSTDWTWRS